MGLIFIKQCDIEVRCDCMSYKALRKILEFFEGLGRKTLDSDARYLDEIGQVSVYLKYDLYRNKMERPRNPDSKRNKLSL
jgi:hypothetical protein